MPDDVSLERTGVKAQLGTTKLEGEGEGEEAPSINVQDFRVAKPEETEKEAVGEERVYMVSGRKSRDAQTQFGAVERQLSLMMKRGKNGEALTDEELEKSLKIIAELPGRREGRDELSSYVAEMILRVNEGSFKGKIDDPEEVWDEFKEEKNVEELGEKHPEMRLVYEYIKIHGRDPSKVGWGEVLVYAKALKAVSEGEQISQEVLREIADRATYGIEGLDKDLSDEDKINKREELYQKLLAKEGHESTNKNVKKWKDNGVKERVFSLWLGLRHEDVVVDVERYWKKRLMTVVDYRLGKMRSQAVARVTGKGEKAKMEITRPRDIRKKEYWKGYNSALALDDLASKTLLGRFLDEMGRGVYWRGKAKIDYAYLSLYMGIIIDHPEADAKSGMISTISTLEDSQLGDHLRGYLGVDAMHQMAQDERVIDVLNRLYSLSDKPYEGKLKSLGRDYGFDPKGDLPDFVTDAVMLEKVFIMDMKNMNSSDRRQQIIYPAQYYLKQAVTHGGPDEKGIYRVVEMLGNNFRFCEGILAKMGFISAMNIKENYHAIVSDEDRDFIPEKYKDQKDLTWQHMFMFMLQLRKKPLRRSVEKGDKVNFPVTPGLVAEFMPFDNDRQKNGVFDHRKAVFQRFITVQREDSGLIKERGRGKAGLDMELVEGGGITVREATRRMIKDFKNRIDVVIDGVEIKTNGHEVFYNDEVAELLIKYEVYKSSIGTPQHQPNAEFANNEEMLENFLNLRNVLQDHRAWGYVWSIDEPEVRDRMEHLKDFEYAERYLHSGADPKKHLLELVKADPFQTLEEMDLTPDRVLKTFQDMGHRLLGHLYERNIHKIMLFAEAVVMIRASQLEIPDAQTLRKMIDPKGEVRVGAMDVSGAVKKLQKIQDASEAHMVIWNQMRHLGYMEKIVQLRLSLINEGFYKRWDDAVSAEARRLVIAEALEWAHTRDLPLKQEAWIYDELATYLEPYQPVESYLVPDVVIKGGEDRPAEVKRTKMAIQSLNRKQIKKFFIDLREEEVDGNIIVNEERGIKIAGGIFGGVREALIRIGAGEIEIKQEANEEAATVLDDQKTPVRLSGDQQMAVFQTWNGWAQVGVRVNDQWLYGWIQRSGLQSVEFMEHDLEGFSRQGETMYQGGRFIWSADDKWEWKLGEWRLDRNTDRMHFYKEKSKWIVNGELTEEQKISGLPYNNQGEVKGFERKLKVGKKDQMNADGWLEEANYPFLVFKSEALRKEFFDERMAMIFSLMFGTAREKTGLKGGQAKVPLRGELYDTRGEDLAHMTRGGYWIQTRMRYVERKNAVTASLIKMLKEVFMVAPVSETTLESLMESYQFIMQRRMWGEDKRQVLRFNKELSIYNLFKKEGLKWNKKALTKFEMFRLRTSNMILKGLFNIFRWEFKPGGMPLNVVFLTVVAAPQAVGILFEVGAFAKAVTALSSYQKLALVGLEWIGASAFAHWAAAKAISLIQVNVDSADLDGFKFLNKFHAFEPVE